MISLYCVQIDEALAEQSANQQVEPILPPEKPANLLRGTYATRNGTFNAMFNAEARQPEDEAKNYHPTRNGA